MQHWLGAQWTCLLINLTMRYAAPCTSYSLWAGLGFALVINGIPGWSLHVIITLIAIIISGADQIKKHLSFQRVNLLLFSSNSSSNTNQLLSVRYIEAAAIPEVVVLSTAAVYRSDRLSSFPLLTDTIDWEAAQDQIKHTQEGVTLFVRRIKSDREVN